MEISSWGQDLQQSYSEDPTTGHGLSDCNKIRSLPQSVNQHAASFINKVLIWKTVSPELNSVLGDTSDLPLGARAFSPWGLVTKGLTTLWRSIDRSLCAQTWSYSCCPSPWTDHLQREGASLTAAICGAPMRVL